MNILSVSPSLIIYGSFIICFIGLCNLFYYSNSLIRVLISSEIIFIGINILLLALVLLDVSLRNDISFFVLIILVISAIELAFGLMLVLILDHLKIDKSKHEFLS